MPDEVLQVLKDYQEESSEMSLMDEFVVDCCVLGPWLQIPKSTLLEALRFWTENQIEVTGC